MERQERAGEAKPVPLPPARSGPKSLIVIAAMLLLFLGALWYLTFAALNARGPDRVFFTEDGWGNETVSLYVSDLDEHGEVLISSLTATIVTPAGDRLYEGPLGQNQTQGNVTIRVDWVDNDGSLTVTGRDGLRVSVAPRAADNLILSTLYLYSDGREWGQYRFE